MCISMPLRRMEKAKGRASRPKILVIRPGALGDTLMLAPAFKFLHTDYHLMVAGRRPGIEILSPISEQSFDMDQAPWHNLFTSKPSPRGLIDPVPDLVICFLSDKGGQLKRNLKAYYPDSDIHVFPALPHPGRSIHASLHILECMMDAGLPLDPEALFQEALRSPVLEGSGHASRRLVLLHPGSGSRKKNLPLSFWKGLFERIMKTSTAAGLEPVFLLGPAEQDLERRFHQKIKLTHTSKGLLETLQKAALFIGHDSGPTHLAAMMGLSTIALFKKTDPVLWHPLGPKVTVFKVIEKEGLVVDFPLLCSKRG